MKIQIIVKPNSKRPKVEKLQDGSYQVCVNAPPVEGRANEAVVEILSEFFQVPKSSVSILKGLRGKNKRVEIISD
ncbi:MAG: DUF167 domain-containing protein [Deltaproteobacteria bacterium]|nr:DUF167 domain-containing protein [Deltaproteobacteria bacterium]